MCRSRRAAPSLRECYQHGADRVIVRPNDEVPIGTGGRPVQSQGGLLFQDAQSGEESTDL